MQKLPDGSERLAVLDQQGYDVCALAMQNMPHNDAKDRLLYAKITLIRDDTGKWALSSVNLIDPCFSFLLHKDASFDLISTFLGVIIKGAEIPAFERKEILEYQTDLKIKIIFMYLYMIMIPLFGSVLARLEYQGMELMKKHPFGVFVCFGCTVMSGVAHYQAFTGNPGKTLPHHFREAGK